MQPLTRLLLTALLAIAFAVPSIGGEGGENAGGTGVWILPHSRNLGCLAAPVNASTPTRQLTDFSHDFVMSASEDLGTIVATATATALGGSLALPVSGHEVRLTATMLASIRSANVTNLTIVISDAQNQGYVIAVSGLSTATATFTIR